MSELGVKGVKPRFNPAKDELPELSKTYLETRNRQMRSKAQTAEMLLAKAREELVLKSLVEKQASYLLVSSRQRILGVPDNLCRKMVNVPDASKARSILREAMHALLNELQDLPSKVTDPNWLQSLEADEGK
jgi:hypothetical protein